MENSAEQGGGRRNPDGFRGRQHSYAKFYTADVKGNTAQFKAHGLLEYYSVSLPKKSRQGVSLTLIYLYNLTKNLAAQSAHLNYAVLPKVYLKFSRNSENFARTGTQTVT